MSKSVPPKPKTAFPVQELIGKTDTHGKEIQECANRIHAAFGPDLPRLALVLGSGFQPLVQQVEVLAELDYSGLPGFPLPRVKGHLGRLLLMQLSGMRMLACCGRAHYYEGHSMEEVTHPIRVLAASGIQDLLLTNAAGGINPAYRPGDFMLFDDHINFMGVNPLRGLPVADERCFVDMTDAYSPRLRHELATAAAESGVTLHQGTYLAVPGPSYETPAEIRAFRTLGADAVGMSTVPEVLVARYEGLEVAAISCITNFAAGLAPQKLSHEEVLRTGRESADAAHRLLRGFAAIHGSQIAPAREHKSHRHARNHLRNSPNELGCRSKVD